jgi:hypothetical protein
MGEWRTGSRCRQYLLLALGLLNFPLTSPFFDPQGPESTLEDEPLPEDIPQPAKLPHLGE